MTRCSAIGTSPDDCDVEIHCEGFATHVYDGAEFCTGCCRVMLEEETVLDRDELTPLDGICFFCGAPAEGNHSIERDEFGEGPEVPLCDAHGGGELPSCEQIWARIALQPGAEEEPDTP